MKNCSSSFTILVQLALLNRLVLLNNFSRVIVNSMIESVLREAFHIVSSQTIRLLVDFSSFLDLYLNIKKLLKEMCTSVLRLDLILKLINFLPRNPVKENLFSPFHSRISCMQSIIIF